MKELLPVVIHCVAEEGEEPRQSHVTIGGNEGVYIIYKMESES